MPKKAGPKRIDPESFLPTVMTAQGADLSVLVCRRRWLRGPDVLGGPSDAIASSKYFCFPIAIEISPSLKVLTNFTNSDLIWIASKPADHGISDRCAKVALAEAWHAVTVTLNLGTMAVDVKSHMDRWLSHKNGVRLRNMVAALHWDRWDRENLSIEDRVAILATAGIASTPRQLNKFRADHGL